MCLFFLHMILIERIVYTLVSFILGALILTLLTPIAALDYQYRVKFLARHEYQPESVSNKVKLKNLNNKIEVFQLLTEDNYVLTLKHYVNHSNVNKRPLLLLTNIPSMSLPLVFLHSHDVWIGYGRLSNLPNHLSISTSDVEFWDSWSYKDIISIDYPKFISFITNLTNWHDEGIDIAAFGYNATLVSLFLKEGKSSQLNSINKIVLLNPMDSNIPLLKNIWLKFVCLLPWKILCGCENLRVHFMDLKDLTFSFIELEARILMPIVYTYNWIQRCLLVHVLHCDDYKWNDYKKNDLVDSLPSLNSLKKTFEHFKFGVDVFVETTNLNLNKCLILKSKFNYEDEDILNLNETVSGVLYHHFDFVYANDINSIIHKKLSNFFSH